jgi:hypothetical protein
MLEMANLSGRGNSEVLSRLTPQKLVLFSLTGNLVNVCLYLPLPWAYLLGSNDGNRSPLAG